MERPECNLAASGILREIFFVRNGVDCWKPLYSNGFEGYMRFQQKNIWTYRRPIGNSLKWPQGLAVTGFRSVWGGVQWFDFMTKIN